MIAALLGDDRQIQGIQSVEDFPELSPLPVPGLDGYQPPSADTGTFSKFSLGDAGPDPGAAYRCPDLSGRTERNPSHNVTVPSLCGYVQER